MYEVDVHYDSKTIVKGARAYWYKKYRQDIYLSPIVLLGVIGWLIYSGESNIFYGVVLALAIFYFSAV